MFRIKKGDNVIVINGSDRGKSGKVLRVFVANSKVLVSGINLRKKHAKLSKKLEAGIYTKEMPIHSSNVMLVDPKLGRACKIAYKFVEGRKLRVSKLSGEFIDVV